MRILVSHYNYMSTRHQELQKAVEYVRRTFADRRIDLDYDVESIRHLDKLLDDEFKNGRLKNSDGGFAKFQGLIMIGISGYLAQVILKNAPLSKIDIQEEDQSWFINFVVTGTGNRAIQPAKRILKRIQFGNEAGLYPYAIAAIKYFKEQSTEMPPDDFLTPPEQSKKPWWKFW